jgi:hypothetical protein
MSDPNSIQVSPRLAIPCPGLFPGQNLNQNEVNNTVLLVCYQVRIRTQTNLILLV